MEARVIFDTGSEHLAVTGALCNNETAGKYHFELDSKFSKTISLTVEEPKKNVTKKSEAQLESQNSTNLTDVDIIEDVQIGEASASSQIYKSNGKQMNQIKKNKQHKDKADRCHTSAYNMHESTSGQSMANLSTSLTYGSAKLTGFMWKDYACLQPLDFHEKSNDLINATFLAKVFDKEGYDYTIDREKAFLEKSFKFQNANKCSFFQFLTLYKGHGLGKEADGILGLAPQKSVINNRDKNYIWSLYHNGIITKPILSFSMASADIPDTSYAMFGGYNSSQIVGGEAGLQTFKNNRGNYKSSIRSWALDTKDFLYNQESLIYKGQTKTYPAVIDTGSSFIAVPPEEYNTLQEKWKMQVSDLDCKHDATFCQSGSKCQTIANDLSPVSFNIGDTIFELSPMAYLHQGEVCQFAIASNPLDSMNNGNFLFGGLFLKHFYSIYDYENELISLGVNSHSKHLVRMHQKGEESKQTEKPMKKKGAPITQKKTYVNNAFEMAVSSENLAGKAQVDGVQGLNRKLNEQTGEFVKDAPVKAENKTAAA